MNNDIQKHLRENQYDPDIVSKESLVKKLAKAGIIMAIGSSGLKKISKSKNIKVLNNDITNIALTSAVMMATSNDDEYITDIGAVGAISALMGLKGIAKYKVNYSSMSDFENVYKKFKKADDVYKKISLFSVNFSSNVSSFVTGNIYGFVNNIIQSDKEKKYQKLLDAGSKSLSSIYNSLIKNPINTISSDGLIKGTKKIFKNLYTDNDYEIYKKNFRLTDINSLIMSAKGINFNNINISDIDYNEITSKQYKKFIKYRTIEKNSTFTDIIGRYTSYDEKASIIKANVSKILEDDAHFGNALNILADNFKRDYESQGLDITEEKFVEYLNNNGFKNIVDKYYKNDKYISYGEISKKFEGKIEDLDIDFSTHLFYGKKSNLIQSDYNNNIVLGFKNDDILKNFAFTNVVEKNADRIIDNTALDGFNTTMNILSIIEKNAIGHYKGPLGRMLNMWSPFSLIQSNARIKNNVHNNLLKLTETNGVILNEGFAFTYDVTRTRITNNAGVRKKELFKFSGEIGNISAEKLKIKDINFKKDKGEIFTTIYKKSDSNSFKVDFKKTTNDILNEDYHIKKTDLKYNFKIDDIYKEWKENGTKSAFSKFTKSNFNPFGIRYEKTTGFRRVLNKDGYYKEGTIFNNAYDFITRNNNEINYEDIVNDNQRLEKMINVFVKDFVENGFEKDKIDLFYKKNILANIEKEFRTFDEKIGKENVDKYINTIQLFMYEGKGYNFVKSVMDIENFYNSNVKLAEEITSKLEPALKKIEAINNEMKSKINLSSEYMIEGLINGNIKKEEIINFLKVDSKEYNEEYLSKILNIVNTSRENKQKAKNILFDSFKNKYKVKDNELEDYFDLNNIESQDNIFFNIYNEILGFENSKIYEKNNNFEFFESKLKEIRKKNKTELNDIQNELKDFDKEKNKQKINEYYQGYLIRVNKLNDPSISDDVKEQIKKNIYIISKNIEERQLLNQKYEKGIDIKDNLESIDSLNNNSFIKKLIGKEDDFSFNSYKKINEIRNKSIDDYIESKGEELISESMNKKLNGFSEEAKINYIKNDLKSKNIFQFKRFYTNLYYKTENNNNYVSNLINSSFEKALESKTILGAVKSFLDDIKIKYSGGEFIKANEEIVQQSILAKEIINNHYKVINSNSSFNVGVRNIFSKFQDAAEVIGIERLTNEKLGKTSYEMFKNFFKYRYLPLMGLTMGAIAINSFSDMIIPDEVPVIGNGIVGVGTRAYATARIGLQYGLKYTGMLSILRTIEHNMPGTIENGFTHFFDPLMDPSEMIDVYFYGKPIEVKKNRNWFTAGRQSAEGEEFGQYRPHLLYIWGNPSSGIYSNKIEKFFRKDFLLTKYPWYILDPYKEEREAYENLGLVHPKTEQLFKDIPIFGHLLSATIGEVIKPTQYIGEDTWRVGDNLMKNPNYDERNPYSPRYIEFTEPNRFIESIFEGIEDLKTFSGLPGYMITKMTEMVFGATNPYNNSVTLSSLDNDTSYYRAYEKMQLGGLMGITEPIRRLLDDGNSLGTIEMNPVQQKIADWMPEYFRNGNHIYSSLDYAEYMIPGKEFDKAKENHNIDKELQEFRTLSMIAPLSENYKESKNFFLNNLENLSNKEREYFYESLSYADYYGKRDYQEQYNKFNFTEDINVKITKKLSIDEFIGDDGRRYKLSGITSDFNKLSKVYGSDSARKLMDKLNATFNVGDTYTFKIATSPEKAVGTDSDGEYLRVDSDLISGKLTVEQNVYRQPQKSLLGRIASLGVYFGRSYLTKGAVLYGGYALTMDQEKIFGNRSAYQEWSFENVQSPYFRDWDSPISSFIEPYYTMSANSLMTSMVFSKQADEAFFNSNSSQLNLFGTLSTLGALTRPINAILGRVSTSSEYKTDTEIQDEIEKIKFISGEKSYYNMTGKENLKQFSKMLNEQDSVYFEGLVNTTNENVREKILKTANSRMSEILMTIWNRQKAYYNNEEFTLHERNLPNKMHVTNIGAYTGNIDQTRNLLKMAKGIKFSKLDNKRDAVIRSYRGGISQKEGEYIANEMYGLYNHKSYISSTISPVGNINLTQRGD